MNQRSIGLLLGCALGLGWAGCGGTDAHPAADGGVDDAAIDVPAIDAVADASPDAGPDATAPTCTVGCSIVELSLGGLHSCARRDNGEVLCWGSNYWGQLGDGRMRHSDCRDSGGAADVAHDCSAIPLRTSALPDGASSLSGGMLSECAIRADGEVVCWGLKGSAPPGAAEAESRFVPQLMDGWAGATQIADGTFHACALLSDATLQCVYQNYAGQLGDGTFVEHRTPVAALATGVLEVALPRAHGSTTCVRRDADVVCWGDNEFGQLGDGLTHDTCGTPPDSYDCSAMPVAVTGLGADVVEIGVGQTHGCARHADGRLSCWGNNDAGQTGLADRASLVLAPTEVPGVTGVQQLAVGGRHTCALHDDGSVSCWGLNRYGQLGDGTFDAHEPACAVGSGLYDCSADPVSVILPSAATFLAAGGSHACAILDTGEIYCWGSNNRAQVGNLDRQPRATPVPVLGFE